MSAFAGCAQIVHVTPGTSVELALARKPEVIKVAQTAPLPHAVQPGTATRSRTVYLPPVEPTLPTNDSVTAAAEAFTRGKMALDGGRMDEAISAFKQATQVDPQFTEAWQSLAMAYEKAGKDDKAREAFRHSKDLAQH
jgi:Flp pilus assembly protein TadD